MLRNVIIFMIVLLLPLPAWSSPNIVEMQTNLGTITLKLDPVKAPITVDNFLAYVNDGFYRHTLFHSVVSGVVIQGGGYDVEDGTRHKAIRPAIKSEADNGLSNVKGTIGMFHTNDAPDSATSEFYINLADNVGLDHSSQADGYTVFGEVIEGMDAVNKIAKLQTWGNQSFFPHMPHTSDYGFVYIENVFVYDDTELANSHTRVTVSSGGKVTSLPGGINCKSSGGTCESIKAIGASKTQMLIAKADSKYVFSGWSGDCVGNKAAIRLPLTRNHNCKANFTAAVEQK